MSDNLSYLSGRKGLDDNLFEKIAETTDYDEIKNEFLIPAAPIVSAQSFYDLLRDENKNKKVFVCNGSTCLLAGTQPALKAELAKHFKEDEIGELCCFGRCYENSAFQYEGVNYSAQTPEAIKSIVSNGKKATHRDYAFGTHGKTVFAEPIEDAASYYSGLNDVFKKSPGSLLEEIKTSGVRGRGGAGFPMWIKLDTCRKVVDDTKYIVCNADEGDPGAFSDRFLLEKRPHAVLYGMMLAGFIVGASYGVVYIRAEYPESVDAVNRAVDELRSLNLLGNAIAGSSFSFDFKVIMAQGAYVCGEETALLSSIEGQRPVVRVRPPFPAEKGLYNKPTIVSNVETFANLHFIVNKGGAAFKAIGTAQSTGTKLLSLDWTFNKPGIYEVEMGTPLSVVVNDLGSGFKKPVKAMHIGGPLGGLVPVSKIPDLVVAYESFKTQGFELGHASVVGIPEDYPMVHYLEHLFEFCAHESCGKCYPCRLGSVRGMELMRKARTENYKIDRELLDNLIEAMQLGSLCALGGGLPLPIINALHYFDAELKPYFKG